ncbi:hypothetical protein Bb109J_c1958 [Bdellovibrio bacteriovorus]|uniref:hypothetical protein n=1 Tax=Bdellovibrio bacteriovorus TaxID=959 RepID=UPI00045C0A27|nr:hypothetical protein [Bdellovibrio bacteriovorus]AHZ84647.1 hypothetical protein EP01_06815 [Bdellovibrio bacteriovorus]BEV68538.1 hypothetical protein Bb109J_c1958 [Bdellovibrio bacteriovorus]
MRNKQIRDALKEVLKTIPDFENRVFNFSGTKRDAKDGAFAEVSTGPTQHTHLGDGLYEKRPLVLVQAILPCSSESAQDDADDLIAKMVKAIGESSNFDGLVDEILVKTTDTAVSTGGSKALGYCEIELEVVYAEN